MLLSAVAGGPTPAPTSPSAVATAAFRARGFRCGVVGGDSSCCGAGREGDSDAARTKAAARDASVERLPVPGAAAVAFAVPACSDGAVSSCARRSCGDCAAGSCFCCFLLGDFFFCFAAGESERRCWAVLSAVVVAALSALQLRTNAVYSSIARTICGGTTDNKVALHHDFSTHTLNGTSITCSSAPHHAERCSSDGPIQDYCTMRVVVQTINRSLFLHAIHVQSKCDFLRAI